MQEHPATPLAIVREHLNSTSAQRLIAALNAELSAAYPEPEARHFRLEAGEVAPDKGAFLVGYLNGEPVTCGAIRLIDAGSAEVKRMYVVPAARGRGFSRLMLSALEERARVLGARRLVLETGPRQSEALGLYKRAGYALIPKFGEYIVSELSICMGKDL